MPNWKKVIVSGSNAVLNNITASGHMSVLNDGFTVNNHTQTELEVVGTISASLDDSGGGGLVIATNISASNNLLVSNNADVSNNLDVGNELKTKYRRLEITGNSTADFNGDVVFFGSADELNIGRIYRYNGSSWVLASKDDADSGKQLLAVSLGESSDINGMLIRGFVTLTQASEVAGSVLYLGTSGLTVDTPPGSGDVSRIIGYDLNNSTDQIYFNPSMDWIDIT